MEQILILVSETFGIKVPRSHMGKYRLDVLHAEARITFQTLEFPLLISRVHQEVTILFSYLLAACPTGFYGEECNQTCSCHNGGICHSASGQCGCMPGWTGPNCTKGEFTQRRQVMVCAAGKEEVTSWFCLRFSPRMPRWLLWIRLSAELLVPERSHV